MKSLDILSVYLIPGADSATKKMSIKNLPGSKARQDLTGDLTTACENGILDVSQLYGFQGK
jgi:hypothetical protein